MSQGTRGGWAHRIAIGLGAALCLTIIGCTELDKPRFGKSTKQPGPGLPGTPTLGQPGTGNVRPAQPGLGTQPMGTAGTPVSRGPATAYPTGGNSGFGAAANSNTLLPNVGPANNDYTPIAPAAGVGNGAPSGSFGGAAAPPLDAPGLTPPAAPGAVGGIATPPGGGPVAPINPQ